MAWLARSLASSLHLDDDGDRPDNDGAPTTATTATTANTNNPASSSYSLSTRHKCQEEERHGGHNHNHEDSGTESEEAESRGIKEDLSELRDTLTRQIWGVASFLAPPPTPSLRCRTDHQSLSDWNRFDQKSDRSDQSVLADVGEVQSDVAAVSLNESDFGEMPKRDSNLISVDSVVGDEELEDSRDWDAAVGVTDEVLVFARNIAMHPETWLDFPLDEEEDLDDFDMTVAQQEHVSAVERHTPTLAALRIELCPCHMTESYFWKVYFVLLHSRLNKHDADILSTPQAVTARAKWMEELHKRTKPGPELSGRGITYFKDDANTLHEDQFYPYENMPHWQYTSSETDYNTEKHPASSTEISSIEKFVIDREALKHNKEKDLLAGPSSKTMVHNYEDEGDEWLEDDSDFGSYSVSTIPVGNDEDVSFSDLEDDDVVSVSKKFNTVSKGYETSRKSS